MLFLSSFASCRIDRQRHEDGAGADPLQADLRELLRTIHPRVYSPVNLAGGPTVSNATVFAVLAYLSCTFPASSRSRCC